MITASVLQWLYRLICCSTGCVFESRRGRCTVGASVDFLRNTWPGRLLYTVCYAAICYNTPPTALNIIWTKPYNMKPYKPYNMNKTKTRVLSWQLIELKTAAYNWKRITRNLTRSLHLYILQLQFVRLISEFSWKISLNTNNFC